MDAWWWVVWFWKLVTEYRNSNRSQGCRLSKSPPSPCLLLSAPLTLLQPHRPPRCSCCLPDMLLPLGALVLCLWCSPPRSPDGLLFPSFRLCTGLPWPLHLKLHCLPLFPFRFVPQPFEESDMLQTVLFTAYFPLMRLSALWQHRCLLSLFNALSLVLRTVPGTQQKAQEMFTNWMKENGEGEKGWWGVMFQGQAL